MDYPTTELGEKSRARRRRIEAEELQAAVDFLQDERTPGRGSQHRSLRDDELPAIASGRAVRVECLAGHSFVITAVPEECPMKACGSPVRPVEKKP